MHIAREKYKSFVICLLMYKLEEQYMTVILSPMYIAKEKYIDVYKLYNKRKIQGCLQF